MSELGEGDRRAIEELKYAYFRLLDTKRFDELGELLTADVTTAYQGGELAQQGREAVVTFLTSALGDPAIVTRHNGHHPELAALSDGVARGTWYLEDEVLIPGADLHIRGSALYDDEYRRGPDGRWRIHRTGYRRIFEEHRVHSTGRLVSFTSSFDPPSGGGSASPG